MEQLPPKAPISMAAHNWASSSFPFQMMPSAAAPPPSSSSWMDDFLDFSSTRRNAHRRTVSDPIAFVEDANGGGGMGFDRLDDEQLRNMFSDDFVGAVGSSSNPSSANPSTPSDQNTDEDEKKAAAELRRFQPKSEPGEVDSTAEAADAAAAQAKSPDNAGGDAIFDPKRVKRYIIIKLINFILILNWYQIHSWNSFTKFSHFSVFYFNYYNCIVCHYK